MQPLPLVNSEDLYYLKRKLGTYCAITPHFPLSQTLIMTNILPVSVNLPILDISRKEHHIIGVLLCLLSLLAVFYFAQCFQVHPSYSIYLYFITVCEYILLYDLIVFCLSICLLMDICIVSTIWLLWVMLLLIVVYKFLCRSPQFFNMKE